MYTIRSRKKGKKRKISIEKHLEAAPPERPFVSPENPARLPMFPPPTVSSATAVRVPVLVFDIDVSTLSRAVRDGLLTGVAERDCSFEGDGVLDAVGGGVMVGVSVADSVRSSEPLIVWDTCIEPNEMVIVSVSV